jgi:hypothetical protein
VPILSELEVLGRTWNGSGQSGRRFEQSNALGYNTANGVVLSDNEQYDMTYERWAWVLFILLAIEYEL